MYNLTVKNYNTPRSVFQNAYNFKISDKNFWVNSYTSKNSNHSNKGKEKYENIGLFLFAGSLLFFSRGVQRKSKDILEKLQERINAKQGKYFFDAANPKVSFYDYVSRKISSFIGKTESINNVNSIKDMLFMKFMYKTKPTKFIHEKISEIFGNLSRNTVLKSYKNTQKQFDKMYKNFDMLDEYILKHNPDEIIEFEGEKIPKRELVERARDYRKFISLVVNTFITRAAQNTRYDYMKKSTSSLYSEIWNASFKDFWTNENKFKRKEMWQTFIAAERIKDNKTDLTGNVSIARNILSYSDAEKKAYISVCINNLNSIIPADDVAGIEIISRLKWYIKDSSPIADNKNNFLKELEQLEKQELKANFDTQIGQNRLKDKNTNIEQIRKIIREDAPGDIDKMLIIYRKIAPVELSKSDSLNSLQKAVASFDKSINLEIGELFDKLRDLEIGSAPTDILTLLISSAAIIHALNKVKNKEEKISVLLKSGIPIAGAIGVTLISATKLVSGSKSLLLGFISGLILNRIGKIVDNYRKKNV